jgi:hypothetical protein
LQRSPRHFLPCFSRLSLGLFFRVEKGIRRSSEPISFERKSREAMLHGFVVRENLTKKILRTKKPRSRAPPRLHGFVPSTNKKTAKFFVKVVFLDIGVCTVATARCRAKWHYFFTELQKTEVKGPVQAPVAGSRPTGGGAGPWGHVFFFQQFSFEKGSRRTAPCRFTTE